MREFDPAQTLSPEAQAQRAKDGLEALQYVRNDWQIPDDERAVLVGMKAAFEFARSGQLSQDTVEDMGLALVDFTDGLSAAKMARGDSNGD